MERKEVKRNGLSFHGAVGIGERRVEQGLNPKLLTGKTLISKDFGSEGTKDLCLLFLLQINSQLIKSKND